MKGLAAVQDSGTGLFFSPWTDYEFQGSCYAKLRILFFDMLRCKKQSS